MVTSLFEASMDENRLDLFRVMSATKLSGVCSGLTMLTYPPCPSSQNSLKRWPLERGLYVPLTPHHEPGSSSMAPESFLKGPEVRYSSSYPGSERSAKLLYPNMGPLMHWY